MRRVIPEGWSLDVDLDATTLDLSHLDDLLTRLREAPEADTPIVTGHGWRLLPCD